MNPTVFVQKKQTATPPSEASDSDAAAVSEQDSAAPSISVPDAKATAAVEEGARRRNKPTVEKKKLKKVLGRNKKFSLQAWLEANGTVVAVVVIILVVLLAAVSSDEWGLYDAFAHESLVYYAFVADML